MTKLDLDQIDAEAMAIAESAMKMKANTILKRRKLIDSKIKLELSTALREAKKMAEFYGNKENYEGKSTVAFNEPYSPIDEDICGDKARAFLDKWFEEEK